MIGPDPRLVDPLLVCGGAALVYRVSVQLLVKRCGQRRRRQVRWEEEHAKSLSGFDFHRLVRPHSTAWSADDKGFNRILGRLFSPPA